MKALGIFKELIPKTSRRRTKTTRVTAMFLDQWSKISSTYF